MLWLLERQARAAPTRHPGLAFATPLWFTFGGYAVKTGSPVGLSPQRGTETSARTLTTPLLEPLPSCGGRVGIGGTPAQQARFEHQMPAA
jgi:hypothetical protein